MASWFTQPRFDLNGRSTSDLMEHARDRVAETDGAARERFPARPPDGPKSEARMAVQFAWRDGPAADAFKVAGLTEQAVLAALERGRFDAVLRDLNTAIQTGKLRDLPEGEALTRTVIEAQSRYDGQARDLRAVNAVGSPDAAKVAAVAEKADLARAGAIAAIETVKRTIDADAVQKKDSRLDATEDYWQAAIRSGHAITPQPDNAARREPGRGQSQSQ